MKKRIKRTLIILLFLLAVIVISAIVFYMMPSSSDYGTFLEMREYQLKLFSQNDLEEREISCQFDNYTLKLPPLYAFMFKTDRLSLYLKSFSGEKIDTATINQLEIGEGTKDFFDFTFMIRPKSDYNAPFFHGDALKALPGVQSALYMDFYSFDHTISGEDFFQEEVKKLEKALELAKPYWKHDGYGELTSHLDPYKSKWRLEIVEPEGAGIEEKQKYYACVLSCFSLYSEAYLNSLDKIKKTREKSIIEKNKKEIDEFVSILYQHDIAVKMGKMIFPEEDFNSYFLDGFWGVTEL